MLKKRYPATDKAVEYGSDKFSKLMNIICWWWADIDKITRALQGKVKIHKYLDTLYNGKLVIDVIADNDAIDLLKIPKISLMINGIWEGKYEIESFMSSSLNFQIFRSIVLNQKNMIGYSPDYVEEISIVHNIWQIKNHLMFKKYKNRPLKKGHIFTYKVWKDSINVRYLLDSISVVAIGIFLQINFNKVQDLGVQWYSVYPLYLSKQSALNDPTLTETQKAAAQADFNVIESQYLDIGNTAYNYMIKNYIIFQLWLHIFSRISDNILIQS